MWCANLFDEKGVWPELHLSGLRHLCIFSKDEAAPRSNSGIGSGVAFAHVLVLEDGVRDRNQQVPSVVWRGHYSADRVVQPKLLELRPWGRRRMIVCVCV